MDKDRRQPLGGVKKETYIHSGGHELTYDLIAGMKSDLCHEIKLIKADTEAIKLQCSCRVSGCKAAFDKRYLKKVHDKVPVSLYGLIFYCVFTGGVLLFAYLYHDKIPIPPLPIF